MPHAKTEYSRFTLSAFDRSVIAQIQQDTGLDFAHAQLLYEYRWKAARNLYEDERTLCEELDRQLARKKAEAAFPLRANGNDRYERGDRDATTKTSEAPPELVQLDLAKYDTEPIPEREWGVRDRFPRRAVCLLSGEGAVGKSLTLLQLSVAHATGRDWLRSMPEPGPVLLVNCEDEGDELVRRLDPILKNYHAKFSDVAAHLHAFSLANHDPLLALPDRSGRIMPTPLYAKLLERARAVQPICTVIDNVADVYGGSEIDRSQVRQFVALMRQIAIAANGYVIMSSHPSLAGIASKTGLSGSTQWHNSVRARAYMHIENDDQSGTRVLEFMKSNYSALSERVELQWSNGLYVPVRAPSAPEQAARNAAADALFLRLLDGFTAKGENVSPKRNANNYAPTLFAKTTEGKAAKFTSDHFADALDRLIAAAKIALEPYGAASRGTSRIVRRRWSP
jgi:RecA-family ATPase